MAIRYISSTFASVAMFTAIGCATHAPKEFNIRDVNARQIRGPGVEFTVPLEVRVEEKENVDFWLYNFFHAESDRVMLSIYVGYYPMKSEFEAIPVSPQKIRLDGSRGLEKTWQDDSGIWHRESLVHLKGRTHPYVHAVYAIEETEHQKIANFIISSIRSVPFAYADGTSSTTSAGPAFEATVDDKSVRQLIAPDFELQVPLSVQVAEERRIDKKIYRFTHEKTRIHLLSLYVSDHSMSAEFKMMPARSRAVYFGSIKGQDKTWVDETGAHHREIAVPLNGDRGPYVYASYAIENQGLQSMADGMIASIRFTSGLR